MIQDRLTLDIDAYVRNFRLVAIRAYQHLTNLDIAQEVHVHVSTSGKGVHIEAHLTERLSDDDRLTLRKHLCDDGQRVELDEARGAVGHATDIYWAEKAGNDGERERVSDIWAALDRIEATQSSGYSQVRALAQYGRRGVHANHGLNRPSLARDTSERTHAATSGPGRDTTHDTRDRAHAHSGAQGRETTATQEGY